MGLLETPAAALAWIGRQGATSLGLGAVTALLFWRAGRAGAGGLGRQPQSRSHGRGGRRRRSRAHLALCRDGAVSHLPAAVPADAGADAIQGMTPGGFPIERTYTLIATDCPAVWEARSCAWCWMMRSRKLLAAALVPALPAAGLVMVICE